MLKFFIYYFTLIITLVNFVNSSAGDRSRFYQQCLEKCIRFNCTEDNNFARNKNQAIHLALTLWSCKDECQYQCQWKTVDIFHFNNLPTPQFYGKWPFLRFLGLQEPASVLFSLLNLYQHLRMIKKFRRKVRPDSPFYWLWHFFCLVCCHAWFWSTVFHGRDFPLTELLDYACAFSIILINCFVMLVRLLSDKVPKFVIYSIGVFCFGLFVNHVMYLSQGKFDYGYNMELNLIIGSFTAICWFGWCMYNRLRQPYVWKCALYVAFTGVVLLLEILDKPPLLYVIDSHAVWHLSTAPLVILIYSFAIDDCQYLRKKMGYKEDIPYKKLKN